MIVDGVAIGNYKAREYYAMKSRVRESAHRAYDRLVARHSFIVLEGAGSPAEINLMDEDFVNKMKNSSDTEITRAASGESLLGDVDGNGMIDIVDALLTAQYYVGYEVVDFDSSVADVDASETIDIVDALLIAQYYVGIISIFPGELIIFPDYNFKEIVRIRADVLLREDVYYKDVKDIKTFNCDSSLVVDITGIEYFTSLEELSLSAGQITDISPIRNLTTLKTLKIENNQLIDISPLTNLTALEELDLENNQIIDISPLANLTALRILILDRNQITDISPLAHLTSLKEYLSLSDNQIADLSPLINLTAVEKIWLNNNQIESLDGLNNMTSLVLLEAQNNIINDISALRNCDALLDLFLRDNQIEDLNGLESPKSLRQISLENNLIEDITVLVQNVEGIGEGDGVLLYGNNLINQDENIQILLDRGVYVRVDE